MKKFLFGVLVIFFSSSSFSSDIVKVTDMSLLDYQISGSKVWIRNLHTFDATWEGCCYNYYIDLESIAGKTSWAVMMMKIASKQSYYLGVDVKGNVPTEVNFTGDW